MSVRGSGQASPQAARTESEAKGGEPRTPLFRHPLDAPGPALPGTQAAEKAVDGCAFQRPMAGAVVLFCFRFACVCVCVCLCVPFVWLLFLVSTRWSWFCPQHQNQFLLLLCFFSFLSAVVRKAQVRLLSAAHTLGTLAHVHLPSLLFRASCHDLVMLPACFHSCFLLDPFFVSCFLFPEAKSWEAVNSDDISQHIAMLGWGLVFVAPSLGFLGSPLITNPVPS